MAFGHYKRRRRLVQLARNGVSALSVSAAEAPRRGHRDAHARRLTRGEAGPNIVAGIAERMAP